MIEASDNGDLLCLLQSGFDKDKVVQLVDNGGAKSSVESTGKASLYLRTEL